MLGLLNNNLKLSDNWSLTCGFKRLACKFIKGNFVPSLSLTLFLTSKFLIKKLLLIAS